MSSTAFDVNRFDFIWTIPNFKSIFDNSNRNFSVANEYNRIVYPHQLGTHNRVFSPVFAAKGFNWRIQINIEKENIGVYLWLRGKEGGLLEEDCARDIDSYELKVGFAIFTIPPKSSSLIKRSAWENEHKLQQCHGRGNRMALKESDLDSVLHNYQPFNEESCIPGNEEPNSLVLGAVVHPIRSLPPEQNLYATDNFFELSSDYLSEYSCCICTNILSKPVTISCGHSFCKSCLDRHFAEKPDCPQCRAPVNSNEQAQKTDLKTERIIGKQAVQCPSECGWIGEFGLAGKSLRDHLSTCDRALVCCIYKNNGCNKELNRSQIETHETECQFQDYRCKHCQKWAVKSHESKCPQELLTCIVPGCAQQFLRREEATHKTDCAIEHEKLWKTHVSTLEKEIQELKSKKLAKPRPKRKRSEQTLMPSRNSEYYKTRRSTLRT